MIQPQLYQPSFVNLGSGRLIFFCARGGVPILCVFGRQILNIAVRRECGSQQVPETAASEQETKDGDEARRDSLANTMTGELVGITCDFWATIEVQVLV